MAARILEIGDDLAARIAAFVPDATVTREYCPKIDDEAFAEWINNVKPLGIFVVPLTKLSELKTRRADNDFHGYGVIFAEKCTEGGVPSKEWLDARVNLVDLVESEFGDARKEWSFSGGTITPVESEISLIFDPDAVRVNNAFWSLWNLKLRERSRK